MKLEVIRDKTQSNPKYKEVVCDFTIFLDKLMGIGEFDPTVCKEYRHYICQDEKPLLIEASVGDGSRKYAFDFRVPGHTCGSIVVDDNEEIRSIRFISTYEESYTIKPGCSEIIDFIGQKLEGILDHEGW